MITQRHDDLWVHSTTMALFLFVFMYGLWIMDGIFQNDTVIRLVFEKQMNGAIECFEKGWDADEEHLNPMAYVALHRIHIFLGQHEEAEIWKEYLEREGGESAVASEYIRAIHDALADLDSEAAQRLPRFTEEE